jgi:Xaa-Pro aminopeptidase
MNLQSERTNTPISTKELERRWTAVRAALNDQHVDVLLMQNNNDFMGGYVKYFTDLTATNGYPITVAFPKDDGMTVTNQGAFGMDQQIPAQGDGLRRGVKRALGTPSYASANYTLTYEAELAEKALERYSGGTIGMVGLGTLPVSLVDWLRNGRLSNTKFVDATDLVDNIKCIKSDEELALLRLTAEVQNAAMQVASEFVRPGKREIEIAAAAEHAVLDRGGEQGLFLCSSYTPGQPVLQANRHFQNRTINEGDVFTLLVESNGPGGYYTELGRMFVLGKATQEMKDEFDFLLEARKFTLGLLKPSVSGKEVWDAYNNFMREHGKPEERRLYCHGQGYDLVERPLVRFDEPMLIQRNMVLACHPTYITKRLFSTVCDDFLISGKGTPERIHKFPEKIVEVG